MPQTNPLDEAKASDLHRAPVWRPIAMSLDRQAPNRVEMATDEDMFDHIQWTVEELAKLEERGQPPADPQPDPDHGELGAGQSAPRDRGLQDPAAPQGRAGCRVAQGRFSLRHLRDENHTNDQTALAFADAVKWSAWAGWKPAKGDPPMVPSYRPPCAMATDALGQPRDGLDIQKGRYVSRSKWLDLDIAVSPDQQCISFGPWRP